MQVISKQELSQHASADDMWMAIHGLVYDVSVYASQHPGGVEVVEALIGQDASEAFEEALHSAVARREPALKLVGQLEGSEAMVQGWRDCGWTEDQGVPDVEKFRTQGKKQSSAAWLPLGAGVATLASMAAMVFFMRQRRA